MYWVASGVTVLADPHGWGHMNGWGWGMAVFGWVFMALVVVAIVWLVRSVGQGGGQPVRRSALDVLDERYARGEIERDEYLERRADLGG